MLQWLTKEGKDRSLFGNPKADYCFGGGPETKMNVGYRVMWGKRG